MSPRAAVTVSVRIIDALVRAAEGMGVDREALLHEGGLDPAQLDDPPADRRIPLPIEEALWEAAARLSGDPFFGLHAAARVRPGDFDVLDYAVRTAPTLGAALHQLIRYNRLGHDVAVFALGELAGSDHAAIAEASIASGRIAAHRVLTHRFEGFPLGASRLASDFTLATLCQVGRGITGGAFRPRRVHFRHHELPRGRAAAEDTFGCAVAFDAPTNAVILTRHDLELPVPDADPALHALLRRHGDALLAAMPAGGQWTARVRETLARSLEEGHCAVADTASTLRLSPRTLQRRLSDEETNHAEILDDLRADLGRRYAGDPRFALEEIAFLLGFSEASAFRRAFRRWTGQSPRDFRRAVLVQ